MLESKGSGLQDLSQMSMWLQVPRFLHYWPEGLTQASKHPNEVPVVGRLPSQIWGVPE